jgi:hypothetical protein
VSASIDRLTGRFMSVSERLPTLHALDEESEAILTLLDDAETPEEVEALEQALIENEGRLLAKTEAYVAVIRTLESLEATRKAEGQRMAARAKVAGERARWLKERLRLHMQATGQQRIETSKFTVRLQQNPPAATVVDEEAVPGQFKEIRTSVHVDLNGIKAHFKETGELVPGVEISRGESLRIS